MTRATMIAKTIAGQAMQNRNKADQDGRREYIAKKTEAANVTANSVPSVKWKRRPRLFRGPR